MALTTFGRCGTCSEHNRHSKRLVGASAIDAGIGSGMLHWGTDLFAQAQRKKIGLIAMFLQLGVQVSRGQLSRVCSYSFQALG
jgi:hypothetical protein